MISGLLSFFGGTAFRWILGEVFGVLRARQEHKTELERLRLEHEQARDRQQWQREAVEAAAAAGIKVVEAKAEADRGAAADAAFLAAIGGVNMASQRSDWIGAWNACIRPALATVGIVLLVGQAVAPSAVVLSALMLDLICAVLGVFVGERIRARGQ
jgi:hypothetical protein